MKRIPINLYMEQGPVDSFDPKSPQKYRIVAEVPGDKNRPADILPLTPTMGDPSLVMDTFRRAIFSSLTRFEADLYISQMEGMNNGLRSLETRTEALRGHMIDNSGKRGTFPLEGTHEWPRVDTTPGRNRPTRRKGGSIEVGIDLVPGPLLKRLTAEG